MMLKLSPEQIAEAIKLLARDERQRLAALLDREEGLEEVPPFERLSLKEQQRFRELSEKRKSGQRLQPQEELELEALLDRGEALTLKNMAAYIQHLDRSNL